MNAGPWNNFERRGPVCTSKGYRLSESMHYRVRMLVSHNLMLSELVLAVMC